MRSSTLFTIYKLTDVETLAANGNIARSNRYMGLCMEKHELAKAIAHLMTLIKENRNAKRPYAKRDHVVHST